MFYPNPKSLAVAPVTFPRFAGTTYLFDNPGDSLRPHERGLSVLYCNLDAPEHSLYKFLHRGLTERLRLVRIMERYRFRPLPATAMHVTVCDHVNPLNLKSLAGGAEDQYRAFLKELPTSLARPPSGMLPPDEIRPEGRREGQRVRFRFRQLDVLQLNSQSDWSLVAVLEPSSAASERVYERISIMRRRVDEQEAQRIGKPPNPAWIPHITLGYFPDASLAESAKAELTGWNTKMEPGARRLRIEFSTIHLYAFSDMTEFFRLV